MSKIKTPKNIVLNKNESDSLASEESFLKVEFLNLVENNSNNDDDDFSERSINVSNLKKMNKKPVILDFSLPKPSEELLNSNKKRFKLKSVNNKPDYKILSGEINTMAYEGKIKPADFNPSR